MTARSVPRSCRTCCGTGEGPSWGERCPDCRGDGAAADDAPPRLRRTVPENEPPRPTEDQLDRIALLIDDCDHRHPEVIAASGWFGRTDQTQEEAAAWIVTLSALVVPVRRRRDELQLAARARRRQARAHLRLPLLYAFGRRVTTGRAAAAVLERQLRYHMGCGARLDGGRHCGQLGRIVECGVEYHGNEFDGPTYWRCAACEAGAVTAREEFLAMTS